MAEKEVKKQIDTIKKTFKNDVNFEWMNETENRIKSDKKALAKVTTENKSLHAMLQKHEKMLQDSEEVNTKAQDLSNMQE